MSWTVFFAEEFEPEFDALDEAVQDAILARVLLLEREGPSLDGHMPTRWPARSMRT